MLDGSLTAAIEAMAGGLYDDASADRKKQVLVNYHLHGEDTLATALAARALVSVYRSALQVPSLLAARRTLSRADRALLQRLRSRKLSRRHLEQMLGATPARAGSDEGPDRSEHAHASRSTVDI
jgi:hypothetical protein